MIRLRTLAFAALLTLVMGFVAACTSPVAPPRDPATRTAPATSLPTTASPSAPGPSAEDPAALPPYTAKVSRIGPALRERMRASHRPGCPLRWRDLRHLEVSYVGFDSEPHLGELVVHRRHAVGVSEVFATLYAARWPVERLAQVDDYAGDDDLSMAANNSSAYNCRAVAGSDAWSQHAYGAAIDLNPVQNPYVRGTAIDPPAGRRFADIDRSAGADVPRGAIRAGDVVVEAFADIGWEWGGDWSGAKDYQHFSASGD